MKKEMKKIITVKGNNDIEFHLDYNEESKIISISLFYNNKLQNEQKNILYGIISDDNYNKNYNIKIVDVIKNSCKELYNSFIFNKNKKENLDIVFSYFNNYEIEL